MNENYENIYDQMPGEPLPLPPTFAQTEAAKKPEITFSDSEHVTAISMLLAGFLIVRFCFYHVTGLLTTILFWAIITLEIVFLQKNHMPFQRSDKVFAVILYLFSCVYTITTNSLIKGLNTVFLVMAGCLFLFRMANPSEDVLRFLPVSLMRSVFGMGFDHFSKTYTAAASGTKSKAFWKNTAYILVGLVIAIPLTSVVASLLINADHNMSAILGNFLKIPPQYLLELVPHFAIGLLIGAGIFSTLYSAVHKTSVLDKTACEEKMQYYRFVPNPVCYAAVTPICILYLLFFISQIPYLTGGFTGETSGYTYAEYARQGFFQLCEVCCINLAVLAAMGFFARISGTTKPLLQKIYSVYLCICSLFLAGTALAKMVMYISVYGMTQKRIYTTWFMILLVIGFMALLIRQFVPLLNIGKIAAVTFVIMFGILCFSRPDALIVHYNANMYLSGHLEEFDPATVKQMSDDALAALSCYSPEEITKMSHGLRGDITAAVNRTDRSFYHKLNLTAWELMINGNGE